MNDLLIEGGFDDLFNETYTARMEEELDEIEEGKLKWTDALHEFYGKFANDLDKFKHYIKGIKDKDTPTDEVCLKCDTPGMVLKWGRFGKYLKCLNCDATRDAEPRRHLMVERMVQTLRPAPRRLQSPKFANCVASRCS